MTPTHKRRARRAVCIQFNGVTVPAGLPYPATLHNGSLMLRDGCGDLFGSLHPADWLVIGEDGLPRIYNNDTFQLMYEVLL